MTDLRTAAQQALEALESGVSLKLGWMPDCEDAITALKAALADGDNLSPGEPVQEPVAHSVIAGALFDIMGWLTSRRERIVLSSADNASPAVEAITEFAKMRGLSLDDAKVQDWNTAPPQRKPLKDEEIKKLLIESAGMTVVFSEVDLRFARAIERAHGIAE